VKDKIENFVRD